MDADLITKPMQKIYDPVASGQLMRDLRNKCRLLQEDVIQYVGVTRSQLSNIESGKSRMSIDGYFNLAKFYNEKFGLNISPLDLMVGKIQERKDVQKLEERLQKAEATIEEMTKRANELQDTINRLVRQIAGS